MKFVHDAIKAQKAAEHAPRVKAGLKGKFSWFEKEATYAVPRSKFPPVPLPKP